MGNTNARHVWSRRDFIKTTASLALGHVASGRVLAQPGANRRVLAYVGSYTTAIDGGSNGKGIYRFEMDLATGAFTTQKLVAETPNPSWIVIHPSKKSLYAVNEIVNQESGSVSAFVIDPASGDLTPLNTVSSEGRGPAHMSLDASGKYAFVANYASGTLPCCRLWREEDWRLPLMFIATPAQQAPGQQPAPPAEVLRSAATMVLMPI